MSHLNLTWLEIAGLITRMSGLSFYEFVCLIAQYNSNIGDDKQHVSADAQGRGYSAEALAHAKKKISEKFNPVESCNLRFTKPYEHLQYPLLGHVLTLFEAYERGCLPFPGSTSEQPAQIMEIFSVLGQLRIEMTKKMTPGNPTNNGRNVNQNKPRTR